MHPKTTTNPLPAGTANWLQAMRHELQHNILPYWANTMTDPVHGGFYGRRNGYDQLIEDAPKGAVLNARILWTFARAARFFVHTPYRKLATQAFEYMSQHFHDLKYGGVYWMVNRHGQPVDHKKQLYAQAFALYGYAEYYRLTLHKPALNRAKELFKCIEKHGFDTKANGYLEAFAPDWGPMADVRLSDKDLNATKTMNTHLHVLEAYTTLYRVWPHDQLATQLHNLIELFLNKFLDANNHFHAFFDDHWRLQHNGISFGHNIEGSWLLYEAAEALEYTGLKQRVAEAAIAIVDTTLNEGVDADGGLLNAAGPSGLTDTDKHWWPQAEAMVGLVNAWQLTANPMYLEKAQATWQFIQTHLIDRQHGEWFWRVNRQGEVNYTEDKAGPWKCPYHNARALMECIERLRANA